MEGTSTGFRQKENRVNKLMYFRDVSGKLKQGGNILIDFANFGSHLLVVVTEKSYTNIYMRFIADLEILVG